MKFFSKSVFIDSNGGEVFTVTTQDSVFGDEDGDGNQDFQFEGGPLFSNGDWVAYPDRDKNGNWYLRVRNQNVPGLRFQLFVNNGAHPGLEGDMNKLVEKYNQKG